MGIRNKKWQKIGILSALMFCAAFTLFSLVQLVADLAAYRAKTWVETWENQTWQQAKAGKYFEPSETDWQKAQQQAALAVKLSPYNADHKEQAARVWASRYPMAAYGDPKAQPFRATANEYFREAIRQRPTWPHTYMSYATNLRGMNELGKEYENAMRQAMHYGPWEPQVLLRIVDINLDALNQLAPSTRDLVLTAAEKGLTWTHDNEGNAMPYSQEMWARVKAHRKEYVLCSWLPMKAAAIRHYCLGETN